MWIIANERGRDVPLTLNAGRLTGFSILRHVNFGHMGPRPDATAADAVAAYVSKGANALAFVTEEEGVEAARGVQERVHAFLASEARVLDLR